MQLIKKRITQKSKMVKIYFNPQSQISKVSMNWIIPHKFANPTNQLIEKKI